MGASVEFASWRVGDVVEAAFAASERDMELFRQVSGDDNPVHSDPEWAAASGFPQPIVYGGLIVAQVSRLLGTRVPGHGCVWQSLNLKFRKPLFVGEEAVVSGRIMHLNADLRVVLVGVAVTANGRRIAEGQAQALLPSGPLFNGSPSSGPQSRGSPP